VGRKPQVRLRRIEDLKRSTDKDMGPKDIFEMVLNITTKKQKVEGTKSSNQKKLKANFTWRNAG